jgi:hypothetical protein
MRKLVPLLFPFTKLPQDPPMAELTPTGTQMTAASAPPCAVEAVMDCQMCSIQKCSLEKYRKETRAC